MPGRGRDSERRLRPAGAGIGRGGEQHKAAGGARASAPTLQTYGRMSERNGRRPWSEFGRAPADCAAQRSRPAGATTA